MMGLGVFSMPFLDFIKNRGQAVSAPANEQSGPGPETAKQMYTREAAQAKETTRPISEMSRESLAEVQSIGAGMKPTPTEPDPQAPPPAAPTSAPAPSDGADNQQPMKQVSMAQDKTAPALSPSSAQMGMKDVEGPGSPAPSPSPSPAPPKPSRSMSPDF
jgi:hypothetical protein